MRPTRGGVGEKNCGDCGRGYNRAVALEEQNRAKNPTVAGKVAEHLADAPPVLTEFGNYEVISEIARGGVGIIYKARQRGLGRIVALKVLQGGSTVGAEDVQRFLHEARAASKLQHPNIVPIHDFGTQDGMYYFTMDFVEGESLADRMERGPVPVREALEIVKQVADALHYAHEHGVVHRDVKPGNILLDKSGHVWVTDFGVAKEVDQKEQSRLTVTGQVMGTPRYMSPEQAGGNTARADRRSDVFSLGVTLYEMLTGQPAFDAENIFVLLEKVTKENPPAPHRLNAKVHRDASTICEKAMEKAPERRYVSAMAMAADIGRFLSGEPIEARPVGGLVRGVRHLRKHWKLIAINSVVFAAIGGAVVYGVYAYLASRPSHLRLQLARPDISVRVDGKRMTAEALQANMSLKPGRHELTARLEPDYEQYTMSFDAKPGERITLPVTLARRTGRLEIVTDPPDAAVTITMPDGKRKSFRGPRVDEELPTGRYVASVHRENYLAQQVSTTVEAGRTRPLRFALPAITLWAVPTSGNVLSVPAVARMNDSGCGDVVVGDDDGKIYCLSGKDGVARWVFRAQDAVQAPVALADINNDGVPDVIVGSTDHRLYCLNGKDGKPLWTFETGGAIVGPTRLKDINGDGVPDVFFGSGDNFVYAVSGADGKLIWKFRAGGRVESALAWQRTATGYQLLVGSGDKTLYALNPATGEIMWKTETPMPLLLPIRVEDPDNNGRLVALLPAPQSADDVLTHVAVSLDDHKVIGVSDAFPLRLDLNGDGHPLKLRVSRNGTECYAADGSHLLWRNEHPAVAPHGADVDGDGILDLIFNNGPDEIICVNGKTGAEMGRIKLDAPIGRGYSLEDVDRDGVPDVTLGAGRKVFCLSWVGGRRRWVAKSNGYFDVPLAQVDGKIVAKNQAGQIAVYTGEIAQPLWTCNTAPQPSPYSGVAAGQGIVADANPRNRELRAFRAADGALLWSTNLHGIVDSPIGAPTIENNHLIVGDGNNLVHCFNATNGATRWSTPLPRVTIAPTIASDSVCVADSEGAVHCLALTNGKERWRFRLSANAPRWSTPPTLVEIKSNEVFIVVNNGGYTYALDGRTGNTLWWFQHARSPAYSRNRLVWAGGERGILATASGEIYWLDLALGKSVWTTNLHEPIMSEVVLCRHNGQNNPPDILVGTMSRRLHCLDGRNGLILWSYDVGAQIRYSVPQLLADSLVFVGTGPPENGLYCLRANCIPDTTRPWFGPWRSLSMTK
jgi:outer membrane protein assembly factor BamB/predicted Ser/Thr protein kinase